MKLMTTAELAELLGFDPCTILRWQKAGKIPGSFRAPSGALRFRVDAIEEWINAGGERAEDAA